LRPRAFDARAAASGGAPLEGAVLLSNASCVLSIWSLAGAMPHLVRDSDGDLLLFVHEGAGELFCDFGHLQYREGDYLLLPRGTMWRLEPSLPTTSLQIEARNGGFGLPDRGLLGAHAQFDPAALETPKLDAMFRRQKDGDWLVRVKRRDRISTIAYPFNPLDAMGWKGNLAPVKLNWRDIRPVTSHRYHLPPSVHATFVADRFVVCTFVPRPIESDPGALKVPFFHSNDDFDEVIFYHAGNFFSRDNIRTGMVSFHPSGFTHGPHPKALSASVAAVKVMTDEVAVMIDARDALDMGGAAEAQEDRAYADSWKPK
jgi:homogentisate 1,2-dioxygenase